ncbi:MAG TPA: toprim domain-containing protein [Nitrococcus sp.]|nr:toprim domain-containing protein [Nitrococcus sp.]
MYDPLSHFCAAIRASGLEPPKLIEPGKLHRFSGVGKPPSNRAGWCRLFEDRRGGCFGDWSSGLSETWQAKRNRFYSRAERSALARRVEAARIQAEAERMVRQADAANRATAIWYAGASVQGNSPYLIRKRIRAHGAKLYKGTLVLPVMDFAGKLASLQFIDAAGRKRGCFIPVSYAQNPHNAQNTPETSIWADIASCAYRSRIIICEGWATGCTLAEDEPAALVFAAIDAGNLQSVALDARCRWPCAELIIAGDDDRLTPGNPGATKAKAAAIAADALLALPQWPAGAPEHLTDFNDLARWVVGGAV